MDAFEMALLFDFYGSMLTEKQCEYIDMRYNQDLSLSEIGQNQGVSRQAVFDNLTRTEAILHRMEENIGCVRRYKLVRDAVSEIRDALSVLEDISEPAAAAAVQRINAALQLLEE